MSIQPITMVDLPLMIPEFFAIWTIIQEAESEGLIGMQAVGEVIRKRQKEKIFSDGTIPGTVLWPYQFSGWNTKSTNRIRIANMELDNPSVLQAIKAWKMSKDSNFSAGSTHYLNPNIVEPLPEWASMQNFRAHVGRHSFYLVK